MSYVRFSDNSTQSSNSYQRFIDDQNKVLEQHTQSPQQLQRQQEQFQQQTQQNFNQSSNQPPQIHSQTPLPPSDDEYKNKQLELRQRQQQLQKERYQSSITKNQQPVSQNFSEMNVSDIKQRFPNTNDVYINEIHRLLQNENSLTLNQASNLAQGNGCGVNGYNDMCPSRPIRQQQQQPRVVETFKQKGNCVGEDCEVKFSTNKRENYNQQSIVDKLKSLEITFYTNSGCGFCKQTQQLFDAADGDLNSSIRNESKLPSGVRGFPHFVSQQNGKFHTGFPRTLDRLYDLLS